jgi:hypothetical protein
MDEGYPQGEGAERKILVDDQLNPAMAERSLGPLFTNSLGTAITTAAILTVL